MQKALLRCVNIKLHEYQAVKKYNPWCIVPEEWHIPGCQCKACGAYSAQSAPEGTGLV